MHGLNDNDLNLNCGLISTSHYLVGPVILIFFTAYRLAISESQSQSLCERPFLIHLRFKVFGRRASLSAFARAWSIVMTVLPNKLWPCIIQSLRPSGSPVAFSAKHEVTKALLNLTLVSSTIRSFALPCLYTHCLYIDSPRRLWFLLCTLARYGRIMQGPMLPKANVSKRLVGPCILNLPPPAFLSLYLAPFSDRNIDELNVVTWVRALFEFISNSLARLVIDMPLRSIYPYEDSNKVRPILRKAFQRLTALEEFTGTRDELYLDIYSSPQNLFIREPQIWASWPRLKRLALYNLDIDCSKFKDGLSNLQNLEVLVLTRADGLQEASISSLLSTTSLKRILIINTARGHEQSSYSTSAQGRSVRNGPLKNRVADVVKIDLPIVSVKQPMFRFGQEPERYFDYEDDPIGTCQVWTRDKAINGELWDMA